MNILQLQPSRKPLNPKILCPEYPGGEGVPHVANHNPFPYASAGTVKIAGVAKWQTHLV
jgi:hypothetical protein